MTTATHGIVTSLDCCCAHLPCHLAVSRPLETVRSTYCRRRRLQLQATPTQGIVTSLACCCAHLPCHFPVSRPLEGVRSTYCTKWCLQLQTTATHGILTSLACCCGHLPCHFAVSRPLKTVRTTYCRRGPRRQQRDSWPQPPTQMPCRKRCRSCPYLINLFHSSFPTVWGLLPG